MRRVYENSIKQLERAKEKLDSATGILEEKLLRQINADYQNCLQAKQMAEETNHDADISLLMWLVREFDDEVRSMIWYEEEKETETTVNESATAAESQYTGANEMLRQIYAE